MLEDRQIDETLSSVFEKGGFSGVVRNMLKPDKESEMLQSIQKKILPSDEMDQKCHPGQKYINQLAMKILKQSRLSMIQKTVQ